MKRVLIGVAVAVLGLSAVAEDAYIETTGTQAFLTDVCPGPWTRVEMGVQLTQDIVQQRLFGVDAADSSVGFSFSVYENGKNNMAFAASDDKGNFTSSDYNISKVLGKRWIVVLDATLTNPKLTMTEFGASTPEVSKTVTTTRTKSANMPLVICASYRGPGMEVVDFAPAHIYYLKVYEADRLIRHYVPYWNDDKSVVGLREMVTGTLATKVGTGDVGCGGDLPAFDVSATVVAGNHGQVKAGEDGDWSASTDVTFPVGTTTNLFARPDEGYEFDCWQADGVPVAWTPELNLSAAYLLEGATEVTARFRLAIGYVQEGLVVHLDGIRNVGVDLPYDPGAAVWKDLKGTLDFTRDKLDSGSLFGRWNRVDDHSFVYNGSTAKAATAAPEYKTIDARLKMADATVPSGFCFYSGIKKTFSSHHIVNLKSETIPSYAFEYNGVDNFLLPLTAEDKTVMRTVAATYDTNPKDSAAAAGKKIAKVFDAGVACAEPYSSSSYLGADATVAIIGDRKTGSAYPTRGEISAIRLYDRVLSDAELLYNANVDRIRFEGADPAELTWPQSCTYNDETHQVEFAVSVESASHGQVKVGEGGAWGSKGQAVYSFTGRSAENVQLFAQPAAGYEVDCWKLNGVIVGYGNEFVLEGAAVSVGVENLLTVQFRPTIAYVQDGLIVYLDGIHNVGADLPHDPNATVWKDLAGDLDFTLCTDAQGKYRGSWGDDHFKFARGSAAAETAAPKYLTLDARVAGTTKHTGTGFYFYSGNKNPRQSYSSRFLVNGSGRAYYFELEPKEPFVHLPFADDEQQLESITLSATYADNDYIAAIYSNGVEHVTTSLTSTDYFGRDATFAIIGGRNVNASADNPGTGNFYSLRLYDRVLTASELAYNACVDRVRFEGADPADVDWPAGFGYNPETGKPELRVPVVASGNGKVRVGAEGEWSGAGLASVEYGGAAKVLKISAQPNSGYEFVCWRLNGSVFSTIRTIDFDTANLIAGENGLTAVFRALDRSKVFDELTVTDGLVYRLDASDPDSLTIENGRVKEWHAVETAPNLGDFAYTNQTWASCPSYAPNAFATGRAGICLSGQFADNGDGTVTTNWTLTPMVANQLTRFRTIFLVERMIHETEDIFRLFGKANSEVYIIERETPSTAVGHGFTLNGQYTPKSFLYLNGVCVGSPDSPKVNGVNTYNGKKLAVGTPVASATAVVCEELAEDQEGRFWFDNGGATRKFCGVVGEVIAYDRELSGAEIRAVNAYLSNKWRGQGTESVGTFANTVWTGEGDGRRWEDARNWSNGLPDAKSSVLIAGASVTVRDEHMVENLRLRDATVTLQSGITPGAKLDVLNLFRADNDVAVTVGSGARFLVAEDVSEKGQRFALTLDGGTFVYAPRCVLDFNIGPDPVNHIRVRPEDQDVRTLPCTVAGSGEVVKGGAGTVALDVDLPETVALNVGGGTVDLCGHDLVLAGLSGQGYLCNSADRVPTVTVENDADVELGAVALDEVNVVKRGEGVATVHGSYGRGGTLTAEAGALASDGTFAPETIPGLIVHLDASRPETLVLSVGGLVHAWFSTGGVIDRFVPDTRKSGVKTTTPPLYSKTAFDGKPGVIFGLNYQGTAMSNYETNSLCSLTVVTNRSVFMVVKPVCRYDLSGDVYYGELFKQNIWNLTLARYGTDWSTYVWSAAQGSRSYLNGAKVYDLAAEVTNYTHRLTTLGKPQVVGYARPQSDVSAVNVFRPGIGAGHWGYPERRAGAVIAEVIAYENEVSEEDAKRLSTSLMRKWGIPFDDPAITGEVHQVAKALGDDARIALEDGTTLDLGGFTNVVTSIAVSGSATVANGRIETSAIDVTVADDGTLGKMSGDAEWGVEGASLTFKGPEPQGGAAVQTSTRITGTLGTVSPDAVAPRVRTSPYSIRVRREGGLTIFVK